MNILSKGIDISKWQVEFQMERDKAEGFDFVIIICYNKPCYKNNKYYYIRNWYR